MLSLLILGIQTAGGPSARQDVLRVPIQKGCTPGGTGDDIVVCGRTDPAQYRLKPLPDRYERPNSPPRAKLKLSEREKLGVEVEQGSDAQGGAINRAMVRYKLKF
ncbi:hypothetical protein [Sphingomonas yantingensis]|uniref:Uncharacterized protein n=1 Tax=Sphingomonas yantingensis TaxID=1241761 RepID=A0A7W9AMJ1_9SPHN|nr:hypothetical protein [Sphingomonas yantingensis]MBB5696919.1 hypothetical protein [Sphingomonas yantingensis]